MNLFDHFKTLITKDRKHSLDGGLIRNLIIEDVLKLDTYLIQLLLSDQEMRANFFKKIDDILVFDKVNFVDFISNKQFLPDSYTSFKNKIGLIDEDTHFISESKNIELSWAFKDCVLVGGQTKEGQKKNEVFWNQTLAQNKVDRLFEPKALTNARTYNSKKKNALKSISLEDHLILKGNNLIALHSLKRVYHGKIKLIYIDPPYNTGGDSFNYNDNFSHSSWLTFMKNRLEVAKDLLSNDGVIYISCDDSENAYLKVLCDEIFGRDKFITNLIWRKKAGGGNDSQDIAVEHEYILAYRKLNNGIYKMPLDDKIRNSYNQKDNKYSKHGGYKTKNLHDSSLSDSPGLHYDITCPDGKVLKGGDYQWKCNKKTFNERLADDRIVFKKVKNKWSIHYKIYLNEEKGKLKLDDNGKITPRGKNLSSILYNTALNSDGNKDIKKLFDGEKPFSYPKPVALLETLILSATKPGDIVLDFFAGSGTTAEAVIKINADSDSKRRFILVEQMDYIEDITIRRLQKALELYKSNESFNYAELLEVSPKLLVNIDKIKTISEVKKVYKKIQDNNLLNYKISKVISTQDFKQLGIAASKKLLFEMIDKNDWYVIFAEIDNGDYSVTKKDKDFSKSFYNLSQ